MCWSCELKNDVERTEKMIKRQQKGSKLKSEVTNQIEVYRQKKQQPI